MFELFRDETYGRSNLVIEAVLALVAVGGPVLLWVVFGPGVFVTIGGIAGFAILGGAAAMFWMQPTGGIVPSRDREPRPKRRRR